MTAPAWVDHAVLWHVYPLRFVGAPAALDPDAGPVPRLRRLGAWLDHLVELGANALLLGPVFASHTHGYDTIDHLRIDPRLGVDEDFDWLLAEAQSRGIRVVLDGVFNHVGRGFGPFLDVLERGAGSPYENWFRRRSDGRFHVFEGHESLVALNHEEPAVGDYVVEVMTSWLARGVSGWRLDAAYAVRPAFWREVAARVRDRHSDAWLFGEVIHGDYRALIRKTAWDSLTQYELWKAVWSSLNDGNLFELAHALGRHDELLAEFVPQTFLGNHDVTRLASRLNDHRMLGHAVVVLMTVGGVPSIYAGDEHGFTGVKQDRAGGDDAVRPAFPDTPEQLSELGEPVFRLHQQLIALRRRHPWLQRARTRVLSSANMSLLYESTGEQGERLVVALNLADGAVSLPCACEGWTVVAGGASTSGTELSLPPVGWAVLQP